jgi:hypothetical protein
MDSMITREDAIRKQCRRPDFKKAAMISKSRTFTSGGIQSSAAWAKSLLNKKGSCKNIVETYNCSLCKMSFAVKG